MQNILSQQKIIKEFRSFVKDYRKIHSTCDEDLCVHYKHCGPKCMEHCTSTEHDHCSIFECMNSMHHNGVCEAHCTEKIHFHCSEINCGSLLYSYTSSKCLSHCQREASMKKEVCECDKITYIKRSSCNMHGNFIDKNLHGDFGQINPSNRQGSYSLTSLFKKIFG